MKSKNIVRPIILIAISVGLYFALSSLLDATILKKKAVLNQPVVTGLEGKQLPHFYFLSADSSNGLNIGAFRSDRPMVFLYVKSGCPFCSQQLNEIRTNLGRLRDIQFYILASKLVNGESLPSEFGFKEAVENITFLVDYKKSFSDYFNIESVPFLSIYGKDQKLRNVFIGNITTEQILDITK